MIDASAHIRQRNGFGERERIGIRCVRAERQEGEAQDGNEFHQLFVCTTAAFSDFAKSSALPRPQ